MQTLDEFVDEIKKDADKFHELWLKHHKSYPEQYPIAMEEDNKGIWYEHFIIFCENGSSIQ